MTITTLSIHEGKDSISSNHPEKDVEEEPTIEEIATLEQTAERIPLAAWLLILCQLFEGFTYFGTYTILQNYIQFPMPTGDSKQAGALGGGRQLATAVTMSYSCLCNLSPIILAIIIDQFWGKYKTLCIASLLYIVGLIILVLTSIPMSVNAGAGLPGLLCALFFMGIAAGGFRTTVSPFMAEQYTRKTLVVKDYKGKKKIINPQMTIQSMFSWCYWATNAGSLTAKIITPTVEKYHSFWLAYLITLMTIPGCIIILLIGRRRYIRVPPVGSIIVRAFRITWRAIRNRWKLGKQSNNEHFLDYAKETTLSDKNKIEIIISNEVETIAQNKIETILPDEIEITMQNEVEISTQNKIETITQNEIEITIQNEVEIITPKKVETTIKTDNQFINDLKQTFRACRVFIFFPIFWMCYNQAVANLISQAAQMNVGPIPNDILQTINPFVIVVFVPIFDKVIYPILRKCKIIQSPIARMTCGFIISGSGIAWTAFIQHLIYSTGPNFNYATKPCLTCQKYNNITVAWQIPSYFLLAIGEILAAITGIEYSYTNAPKSMKSIVMSFFLCTKAFGSILNLSLVPVTTDPQVLWMYTSQASATFVIGIIFYIVLRNHEEKRIPVEQSIRKESILSVARLE
ncbi:unnamed protein product [Adineta steineri]|uniref:Uncharacterized protein n=1 Tax=Adineta steineri TaxID=433720 RepID=A0A814WGZ8_9BILA|nr:unnamed protein product [Adineta steineri]CAF1385716.1 unnamed protein product [Adineta steineri]